MTPTSDPTNDVAQAVERLKKWSAWDGDSSPDPYKDSGHTLHDDIRLLLAAYDRARRDAEVLDWACRKIDERGLPASIKWLLEDHAAKAEALKEIVEYSKRPEPWLNTIQQLAERALATPTTKEK